MKMFTVYSLRFTDDYILGSRVLRKVLLLFLFFCVRSFGQAQTGAEPILGGELSNSAATLVDDIREVMPRMKAIGLNTVLVPVYWEFLEPTEGQFDYTLVDEITAQARQQQLKVVLLWFGVWKNSMSCYAPLWFKQDTKRFPRAMTAEGKQMEIASCFSDKVLQADLKAFTALMRHVKETATDVVTMVQIENEIGMLESARDHSPLAERVWKAEGRQGNDPYEEERFMAKHYAIYVEHLAKAARQICPTMPLYVNAAMNSRGRQPGQYPSAGPLAHLAPIWKKYAPSVDLMAPDIYDTGFKGWAAQYAMENNRLFIPESRCCENSGVRALYAFGEHRALGFSPFAIDQADEPSLRSVAESYALSGQLFRLKDFGQLPSWGLLFDQDDKERIIEDGETVITCRHFFTLPWDPRATDGSVWPEGGAILLKLGKGEYLLAGSGIVVSFGTAYEKSFEQEKRLGEDGFVESGQAGNDVSARPAKTFKGKRLGIGFVDQVTIGADGNLQYLRRENGDQDHQGRHARIACGEWKILHIKLYEY